MKISITLTLLLFLTACNITGRKIGNNELATGSYYNGDGLGVNISIQLKPNGTYTSEWKGCLGNYGNSKGTWQTSNEYLFFSPTEEYGMMEDKLGKMKIVEYKGEKGFVPETELNEHQSTLNEFGRSFNVYTLQNP